MDTKQILTLDMNGNGKPDIQEVDRAVRIAMQEPEFIQRMAQEIVREQLTKHPHTLFSRVLSKVKAGAAWLGL